MKKMLALLLCAVMVVSVTAVAAYANSVDIKDEVCEAVIAGCEGHDINKEDISFDFINPLTKGKYLVRYFVSGLSYQCDMAYVDIGKYLLVSSRPLPEVYDGGILYSLEEAYKYKILNDQDLELMDTFEELSFSKTKISQKLEQAMFICDDDEYINVEFELEGSDKDLEDFDNWYDDISGAYDKLEAHWESLHDKFINETLKDYDYIDLAHSEGFSVVAVKKGDIEKIAQDDFVLYMDYISDVHAEFIKAYSYSVTGYKFNEIVTGYDENFNDTYTLVKVEAGVNCQSISFRFGDLIIKSGTVHPNFNYGYAVYDMRDKKFYDIFDIRNNRDEYKNIEKYLAMYCEQDLDFVGDSDLDDKVTILDATKIQRSVAKLESLSYKKYYPFKDEPVGYVLDMDNDGRVSVMDATAIQFKLASF